MTKAKSKSAALLEQQLHHGKLVTPSPLLPDGQSVDCPRQAPSGLMAFYSDSPMTPKNVCISTYSLNKNLDRSPARWFFPGTSVPPICSQDYFQSVFLSVGCFRNKEPFLNVG